MIVMPGIYPNVALAEYYADPCQTPSFTQSLAKIVLDQSALHARNEHPRLRPAELEDKPEGYTKPQAIGSAAHRLLIGRGKDVEVIAAEDFRKGDAQRARDEAVAQGKVPILEKHYARALEMVGAARLQMHAAGWDNAFNHGAGETCVAWEEDGLWFRSLIDWMDSPITLYDYKTGGGNFAPHVIANKAEADGWDVQAAFEERGLNALDRRGIGRRRFRFAAQENYPPYALVAVELSEHWLEMGRKKVAMAIDIWRRAMESGTWPSYPSQPIVPDYPGYREAAFLDREMMHHDAKSRRDVPSDILMGG